MIPNQQFWRGKRVLVTGHTGFKGAWLVTWLAGMGAQVCGYAHAPEGDNNLWVDLALEDSVESVIGDINDARELNEVFQSFQPEIVFHLAAQSLVLESYDAPVETFASNVLGVVSLLIPATILGLGIGPSVAAHEGSTLIVVFNALRLLVYRDNGEIA